VGICYAREQGTDGLLDDAVLPLLAVHAGMTLDQTYEVVDELVGANAWEIAEEGWAIAGYLRDYPSRSQAEEARENRRAAMQSARSKRWSSTTDQARDIDDDDEEDGDEDDHDVDEQLAETELESNRNELSTPLITRGFTDYKTTSTQPLPELAETDVGGGGAGGNDGDGEDDVSQECRTKVERAIKLLALDELNAEINKGRSIKDKGQYLTGIRNRVRDSDGPALAEFAEVNPTWTARQLADALRPAPPPMIPTPPRPEEWVREPTFTGHKPDFAAIRAEAERVRMARIGERKAAGETDEQIAANPDPTPTESEART